MERVSLIDGSKPILIVAPHGFHDDDERTALIAENLADILDCYAVINRGWERADVVDCINDKADCNNLQHCHEDVVKDEFLDPILRYKQRIVWGKGNHGAMYSLYLRQPTTMYMFLIHGMANKHRQLTGEPKLDLVIGYGAGSPDSFSCEPWRKDYLAHRLSEAGMCVFQGKKGGAMSGWARNNTNQLFRKWYQDPNVHSMQLEIVHALRQDDDCAKMTSEYLAAAIDDLISCKGFKGTQPIKEY